MLASLNIIEIIDNTHYKFLKNFPLEFLSEEQLLNTFNFTSKYAYEILPMLNNCYSREAIMSFFNYSRYSNVKKKCFKNGLYQINKVFNTDYVVQEIKEEHTVKYVKFVKI